MKSLTVEEMKAAVLADIREEFCKEASANGKSDSQANDEFQKMLENFLAGIDITIEDRTEDDFGGHFGIPDGFDISDDDL